MMLLLLLKLESGKFDEARSLHDTMMKKFKHDKMVWMNTCLFYVRNSKLDTARSVFQKALTAIDKKERKYHTHTVQYSKYTWDAFISCFFTFLN